ncbi:hypothetical protein [Microvirga arsenatis]|uniref:Transposase n=1 Tax=Microvirga arsenatis TaxID=2692265 RepID=A0ABW9Z240_9HYPH|nr:hypothetical protein [Microvirga arsenatis]NBJ13035.1 hypothetical protein [Microvirga arsenatis]NBJ26742.1 hypothetical protein [Microvirga arsenatis]
MLFDSPLPLEAVPQRARRAILEVFDGRWPTVREVARISDKQWLATPGVGATVLSALRQVAPSEHEADNRPCTSRLSDEKLLARLERLQDELRSIERLVRVRLSDPPQGGIRGRQPKALSAGSPLA